MCQRSVLHCCALSVPTSSLEVQQPTEVRATTPARGIRIWTPVTPTCRVIERRLCDASVVRMRFASGLRLASFALPSIGFAACGGSSDVSLVGVVESRPGVLEFATSCAEDVSVQVEETVNEVRISHVVGTAIDGDCQADVFVQLDAPLGGRNVVVNGERWVELSSTCPPGSLGPPILTEEVPTC
jgi:hypothetical protein